MQQSGSASRTVGRSGRIAAWCAALALTTSAVAAATPAQTSPPLPEVAQTLGPPPTNCPPVAPKLVHFQRNTQSWWVQGGALAGYTLWQYDNHHLTLTFGARMKYGYTQKIFWQRTASAPPQVAIYGWNLRTGQRIWFGMPLPNIHPEAGGAPAVIAWPAGLVRDHYVRNIKGPSFTFVPAAGCYVIRAQWKGGGWSIPFAAGSG